MDKSYVSLKTIYRFYMENDFPVFSTGIISRKNKMGITVQKFWRNLFVEELHSGYYGKMIFRGEGSYNRLFSEFINRKEDFQYYEAYFNEIKNEISITAFVNQIELFLDFYEKKEADIDVFYYKMLHYFGSAEFNGKEGRSAYSSLEEAASYANQYTTSYELKCFYAAYYTTLFMLYCCTNDVTAPKLNDILRTDLYQINTVYNWMKKRKRKVAVICDKDCSYDTPLSYGHFFGREKELMDLKWMVANKKKVVITGSEKTGKSEIIRQLIKQCEEDALVDCVLVLNGNKDIPSHLQEVFKRTSITDTKSAIVKMIDVKDVLIIVDDYHLNNDLSLIKDEEIPILLFSSEKAGTEFLQYELLPIKGDSAFLRFREGISKQLSLNEFKQLENEFEHRLFDSFAQIDDLIKKYNLFGINGLLNEFEGE